MRAFVVFCMLIFAIGPAFAKSAKLAPAKGKPNAACQAAYETLYAKPVVNFRMAFGYKDTRPARFVGDRHERLAFVQRILSPCRDGAACGFTRSPKNSDLFTKTIKGPKGKPVKIQLWVAHSSVGTDDQENRADPFQKWQSRYANEAFFDGLKRADVVFYNGHSRFGGGPDFQAPQLRDESMSVDEPFYKAQRPGFSRSVDVLQEQTFKDGEQSQLKILGFFSCESTRHFTDDIQQYSSVALITSRQLMYYADALENSLSALSAVLEMRCQKDFNQAIRSGPPSSRMGFSGFFPAK